MSRAARVLGRALIVFGALLLAYTGFMQWSSDRDLRSGVDEALRNYEAESSAEASVVALRPEVSTSAVQGPEIVAVEPAAARSVSGVVSVPSEGLEAVLRPSVADADLDLGVGHYPGTAGPGEQGNFAIAAHRGLVPELQKMGEGDTISVASEGVTYTYAWSETLVVDPEDVWVLDPPKDGKSVLTLTTCHPRYSTDQRLVIRAELVRTS